MRWPWLIGLVLLFAVPVIWNWEADTIPVNNGFGWDGNMYGMYTQFLPEAIDQGAINTFRMQRMLIPASLYWIMEQAGMERNHGQVIRAYRVVNVLFIALAMIIFFLLCKTANWYQDTIWLGFAALFFSMPFMKMSQFYPILADVPAFTIGLWAVFCWVKGWRLGLLLTILIGAFAGPTMWAYGLLLLPGSIKSTGQAKPMLSVWWALIPPILFMAFWLWLWQAHQDVFFDPPNFSQSVRMNLLPFSLLLVLGYLWWVGQLIRTVPSIVSWLQTKQWVWLLPLALVFLVVQWIVNSYAGDGEVPQTLLSYIYVIMQQSVTYPGGFAIAHFAYIPGFVLMSLLAAPWVHRIVQSFGPGPLLLTTMTFVMMLGSETRQLMQVLPWLFFLFLTTIDADWRFNTILLVLIILGLWISAPWWTNLAIEAGTLEGLFLREPAQRFFRYHGPWMNQESWLNQLLGLLGVAAILGLSYRFGFVQSVGTSKFSAKTNP